MKLRVIEGSRNALLSFFLSPYQTLCSFVFLARLFDRHIGHNIYTQTDVLLQNRAENANRFHCRCILLSYYAKWKQYVHSDKKTEEGRRFHIAHININKSIEPYTRLSGSNKLNIGKSSLSFSLYLSSYVCMCFFLLNLFAHLSS